jgi:hypothetical protein
MRCVSTSSGRHVVVDGIHHLYIETHNWGRSVAFWQALGYRLDEDHGVSGILRASREGDPYIYLAEVPSDSEPVFQLYLNAGGMFEPAKPVVSDGGWQASHWGTKLRKIVDPDGRTHMLQVVE